MTPPSRLRVRFLATPVLLVAVLTLAACSSDSDTDEKNASGGGATSTTQACPFSGATTPTSAPAASEVATELTQTSTRKDGCIDNIQFDFSPGLPAWSVQYESSVPADLTPTTAPPSAPTYLVVRFPGAKAGSGSSDPTVATSGLDYVTSATQATDANGSVAWILGMGSQRQFLVSTSSVPTYVILGIG